MGRFVRALLDGLLLRCPRCHRGGMFERGMQMRGACPSCGMPFEAATGEVTGGMGINISVTLVLVMAAAMALGLNPDVPLGPLLLGLGLFAVVFPIAFYRSARGMWVGVLFLTSNQAEAD